MCESRLSATEKITHVLVFRRFGVPLYTLPPPKSPSETLSPRFPWSGRDALCFLTFFVCLYLPPEAAHSFAKYGNFCPLYTSLTDFCADFNKLVRVHTQGKYNMFPLIVHISSACIRFSAENRRIRIKSVNFSSNGDFCHYFGDLWIVQFPLIN